MGETSYQTNPTHSVQPIQQQEQPHTILPNNNTMNNNAQPAAFSNSQNFLPQDNSPQPINQHSTPTDQLEYYQTPSNSENNNFSQLPHNESTESTNTTPYTDPPHNYSQHYQERDGVDINYQNRPIQKPLNRALSDATITTLTPRLVPRVLAPRSNPRGAARLLDAPPPLFDSSFNSTPSTATIDTPSRASSQPFPSSSDSTSQTNPTPTPTTALSTSESKSEGVESPLSSHVVAEEKTPPKFVRSKTAFSNFYHKFKELFPKEDVDINQRARWTAIVASKLNGQAVKIEVKEAGKKGNLTGSEVANNVTATGVKSKEDSIQDSTFVTSVSLRSTPLPDAKLEPTVFLHLSTPDSAEIALNQVPSIVGLFEKFDRHSIKTSKNAVNDGIRCIFFDPVNRNKLADKTLTSQSELRAIQSKLAASEPVRGSLVRGHRKVKKLYLKEWGGVQPTIRPALISIIITDLNGTEYDEMSQYCIFLSKRYANLYIILVLVEVKMEKINFMRRELEGDKKNPQVTLIELKRRCDSNEVSKSIAKVCTIVGKHEPSITSTTVESDNYNSSVATSGSNTPNFNVFSSAASPTEINSTSRTASTSNFNSNALNAAFNKITVV